MRCPQCGTITLATTQTHGVASAYCEDCAQWWEWVPRQPRIGRAGRQGRTGSRWVARVAAGPQAPVSSRTVHILTPHPIMLQLVT